jgi:thiamine pyrophosphate-dependent acetolactate synthase large subunit-like protein
MPSDKQLEDIEQPEGLGNREIGWGSDVLAETLNRMGFPYIALTPGASYRGLHDSLVNYLGNQDPKMLLSLHEECAVAIAHGYAKATDKPMAVAIHANVGLMHSVMAIYNAWCDRAPMFIIGATGSVDAPERRHWIEWIHTSRDQAAMVRPFLKWDDQPSSVRGTTEAFLRAFQMCQTPPCGPTYVCLDVPPQEEPVGDNPFLPDLSRYQPPPLPPITPDAVKQAKDMLVGAKKPMILAGRAKRSREGWDARVQLAEMLGARVITTSLAAAAFPTPHPLHVGWPRQVLSEEQIEAIRDSDVILSLDLTDLAGRLRMVWPDDRITAKIIDCSIDVYNHNGWSLDHQGLAPADCKILADPDTAVTALLEALAADGAVPKTPAAPRQHASKIYDAPDAPSEGPIHLTDIAAALSRVTEGKKLCIPRLPFGWPDDAYIFDDPMDYLGRDGGGGVGSAPGISVGAALALREMKSDRLPVAIIGDGEFIMGTPAIWTAAHYRIPVLIIVGNNRSFFNDEVHQERMAKVRNRPVENKWIGMRMDDPAPNLAGIARDYGLEGIGPVTELRDLEDALARGIKAVEAGNPCVIDVVVPPEYR